jgi:hypothetical protein
MNPLRAARDQARATDGGAPATAAERSGADF